MFSGLRLIDGICLDAFVRRFGKSASELYPQISGWVSEGLMETDGNRLRPRPAAFWLPTPYSCISSSQAAEKDSYASLRSIASLQSTCQVRLQPSPS